MEVLTTPAEMRAWRRANAGGSVGFVPTMGSLHEGHLSLVAQALAENELAVASIFVNPAQFGPGEDFERYPRDEERDLRLLRDAGAAAVYLPAAAAIYPAGYQTYVTVEDVARRLEGEARPGHFRGVATVVLKLLQAVQPGRAYFGRKDAQQLRVIRRMVLDLDLPVEVVACATVREEDGVAMSSRNVYLSPQDRAAAVVVPAAVREAAACFEAGERDADVLRQRAAEVIAGERRAHVEYVSLADDETLEELRGRVERRALLSLAVRFGRTRLLDNVELG